MGRKTNGSSNNCCQGFRSDSTRYYVLCRDGLLHSSAPLLLQIFPIGCLDLSCGLYSFSQLGSERVITSRVQEATQYYSSSYLGPGTPELDGIQDKCSTFHRNGDALLSYSARSWPDSQAWTTEQGFFLWSWQKTMSTTPPEKCRENRRKSIGADSRAAKECPMESIREPALGGHLPDAYPC